MTLACEYLAMVPLPAGGGLPPVLTSPQSDYELRRQGNHWMSSRHSAKNYAPDKRNQGSMLPDSIARHGLYPAAQLT